MQRRVLASIVLLCACLAALISPATARRPAPGRTVPFSGLTWTVKSSAGRMGPGPNYFSSATDSVWVDASSRLHLRIRNVGGTWYCAEVIAQASLGYGTYRWTIDSPLDGLDPNVVLGLFTWHDRPLEAHRELDFEIARWGNASEETNAQYVVQPYDAPGHLFRFTQPAAAPSTHSFTWRPATVEFASTSAAGPIASWTFAGDVPRPGGENPRMNLWLFGGRAPADGAEVEIVISRFEFVPA